MASSPYFVCLCEEKAVETGSDQRLHRASHDALVHQELVSCVSSDSNSEYIYRPGGGIRVVNPGLELSTAASGPVIAAFQGYLTNYSTVVSHIAPEKRQPAKAELICDLFQKFGVGMVSKLEGGFAFCLYDSKTMRILAARGRGDAVPLVQGLTDKGNLLVVSSGIVPAGLSSMKRFEAGDFKYGWYSDPRQFETHTRNTHPQRPLKLTPPKLNLTKRKGQPIPSSSPQAPSEEKRIGEADAADSGHRGKQQNLRIKGGHSRQRTHWNAPGKNLSSQDHPSSTLPICSESSCNESRSADRNDKRVPAYEAKRPQLRPQKGHQNAESTLIESDVTVINQGPEISFQESDANISLPDKQHTSFALQATCSNARSRNPIVALRDDMDMKLAHTAADQQRPKTHLNFSQPGSNKISASHLNENTYRKTTSVEHLLSATRKDVVKENEPFKAENIPDTTLHYAPATANDSCRPDTTFQEECPGIKKSPFMKRSGSCSDLQRAAILRKSSSVGCLSDMASLMIGPALAH